MRYSVRDHRNVVHMVNWVYEVHGAVWVPALEAREKARTTGKSYMTQTMCDAKVKIHARVAKRIGQEAHTCLMCIKEEEDGNT